MRSETTPWYLGYGHCMGWVTSEIVLNVEETLNGHSIWNSAARTPIAKLAHLILLDADRKNAEEIHIQGAPTAARLGDGSVREVVEVFFKIDGELWESMRPPARLYPSIRAYLRYVAGLGVEPLVLEQTSSRYERWLMRRTRVLQRVLPPPKQPGQFRVRINAERVVRFHLWLTEDGCRLVRGEATGEAPTELWYAPDTGWSVR